MTVYPVHDIIGGEKRGEFCFEVRKTDDMRTYLIGENL